jgi:hypothetical protein
MQFLHSSKVSMRLQNKAMWVGGAPIFIRLGYVISSTMEVVLMVHDVGMHME